MISYKARETVFNTIMVWIRKVLYVVLRLDKHEKYEKNRDNRGYLPIMSYNPITKFYRFNCYCLECPCNSNGLCSTQFYSIPVDLLHEFDGDNIIKNFCG